MQRTVNTGVLEPGKRLVSMFWVILTDNRLPGVSVVPTLLIDLRDFRIVSVVGDVFGAAPHNFIRVLSLPDLQSEDAQPCRIRTKARIHAHFGNGCGNAFEFGGSRSGTRRFLDDFVVFPS